MNRDDIISLLYDPSAMAAYGIIIFSLFSPIGLGNLDIITSILAGVSFLKIIPSIPFLYCLKKGYVDANLTDRKKRMPFFLIASVSSVIGIILFYLFDVKILLIFSIAYFVGSVLIGLITHLWKISMHVYGITATITALVYVFGIQLIPLYLFSVIVIYVRYKKKYHSILELLSGGLLGILATWLIYFILW